MHLREATTDDLAVLREYWYRLASGMEAYSEFNTLVFDSAEDVPVDGFEAHLDADDVTEYLLVEDDTTVGFLTLQEGRHPSREYSRYLRLVNLFVEPDARNQGYGSAVVDEVKAIARANGCDHLKVSCEWANDGARQFYRQTGFAEKQVTFVQEID